MMKNDDYTRTSIKSVTLNFVSLFSDYIKVNLLNCLKDAMIYLKEEKYFRKKSKFFLLFKSYLFMS